MIFKLFAKPPCIDQRRFIMSQTGIDPLEKYHQDRRAKTGTIDGGIQGQGRTVTEKRKVMNQAFRDLQRVNPSIKKRRKLEPGEEMHQSRTPPVAKIKSEYQEGGIGGDNSTNGTNTPGSTQQTTGSIISSHLKQQREIEQAVKRHEEAEKVRLERWRSDKRKSELRQILRQCTDKDLFHAFSGPIAKTHSAIAWARIRCLYDKLRANNKYRVVFF